MEKTSKRLKAQLAQGAVLAPGVFDAMTALIAEQAGFEAVYLSGASIAYTRLGRSDVGLTTFTEVEDTLARIAERVDLPVIVDADTGFGNALNVKRTVRGFERAGAAMIQLEDQTFPKRCGHLDGKGVISVSEMCGKLRAAVDARASSDTLILARTDAVAVEGIDAAFERAERYLEAGVDALFIEALRSVEQMEAACQRFASRVPLLANMLSHRDFSGRHGSRGCAYAARLLSQPARAWHDRAVARPYARFRRHQRCDRHARADDGGPAVRIAIADACGARACAASQL
jgi:2-methylisocitrate lyase-like PEP mutase family enzyme